MNKLKTNISAFCAALAGFALTACSQSFLDVESVTESTTDNFYKTENDAWRALLGCYDGWRQTSSNPSVGFYCMSTVLSDETYGGAGAGDGNGWQVMDRFDITLSPSDVNKYEQDWKNYYAGVYRCNELIAHENQIAWSNDFKRGTYMGECRGLRATLYFDMVRTWGNIPLFLEPVNENRPQADPDSVYKAIFEDLKYAAANIPSDAYPKASAATNDGHFTKFAAEGLLARVYLFYKGYYGKEPEWFSKQEALEACEDIIANSGCSLVPEYKNLWPAASLVPMADGSKGWDPILSTYAGEANSEVIFQMKFTPSQDYNGNNDSNRWQVMVGMRTLNAAPYGKGWGGCTVCPSFVAKYDSKDLRRTASIIDLAKEGITENPGWAASYKDQREYTGYTIKKYSPLCFADGTTATKEDGTGDFQTSNPQNLIILRLADVMLMACELGSPNATSYMHEIRSRAGLGDVEVTQENIMKERALELAFEGIRYWDLLRQGIDVAAEAIAATSGICYSAGQPENVQISAENVKKTKGLSQIPQTQITLSNGSLIQNPGW